MKAVFNALLDGWQLRAGDCTSGDSWATLALLDAYLASNGLRRISAPRSLDWRVVPTEYRVVEAAQLQLWVGP